jgi:hypothetical protein
VPATIEALTGLNLTEALSQLPGAMNARPAGEAAPIPDGDKSPAE